MSEIYPDDATLLAIAQDEPTGVEYIATGQSPYYLQFRRLLQRLLLAAQRANDLRVYQDGPLSVGIRGGRCVIANAAVDFAPVGAIDIPNDVTTYLWLDTAGTLQINSVPPDDRAATLPLARVTASAGAIVSIVDLRGETLLAVPSLATFGITATATEMNQTLQGVGGTVTAAALNDLTGGPMSTGDNWHRHMQVLTSDDAETQFLLMNVGSGGSTNIALNFHLPNLLPDATALLPDSATGWLKQRFNGTTYALLGSVTATFTHEGDLTASETGKLIGVVPISGVISTVILSVGTNIDSSDGGDGVTATVKVRGVTVATTDPAVTQAAGSGFRSTAQGGGTSAVIKSDGTQNVQRGDVLTVDVIRTAAGTITAEAADVVVMVVIRAANPE